ncbi:MAG: quinone-dependent dihydroorotate dehydrogenase [Alphaproteobacteria bacterium]|nr:quinone-dependent dihydroorotate dehydrogenase [Alphaproteobacteria bacterium]MBV9063789.1 quinone-dependent dihydroorotate dehydrogenase [Alphaproteobacteria bacterium]
MLFDFGVSLLRRLPAEAAHRSTVVLVGACERLLPQPPADDTRLAVQVWGRTFPNPLGLAAGFDKDAKVPGAMLKLGLGFVECGTVTPRPQPGNARPRLFRLARDRAIINRMGFNNGGMDAAAAQLRWRTQPGVVGINVGANKDSIDRVGDYCAAFETLAPLADYTVINVSSPNTPGLRALQDRAELERLLQSLSHFRGVARKPLLLKIAPDLEPAAVDDIAEIALAFGLDGIIATNTTVARPAGLHGRHAGEAGGLSGRPLFQPSTAVLKRLRARVGNRLVLIGAGGVSSGADAYAKIRAGASLVQLYTALVYEGPGLVSRIKREMLRLLEKDGFSTMSQAIGTDASKS